jgi:hypothetical protein
MRISAALALLLCALTASAQVPDLILLNGKVITVDDRFSIAQAIAIQSDRFLATGSSEQIARLAGPLTRRIDLHGRTVIPGLIDDHIHLLRAASTWQHELRFDGVYSRAQALDMLRARVKAAQAGEWIYNIGGWTHQQFADNPAPCTRSASKPTNPIHPSSSKVPFSATRLACRPASSRATSQPHERSRTTSRESPPASSNPAPPLSSKI